ncbi:MAG: prolipoprotein diacylglyceryl transferase, partial [Nannocystaceae bacterium]|nr:prolipoprotein diacylglyceryl transferase [Nannocystaceae bacterium]
MIPFVEVARVSLGPVGFHPFGLLVTFSAVLGIWVAAQFGRRRGIPNAYPLLLWVGAAGVVGAHWVSAIFYFPERFVSDPWVLFRVLDGLASVGGFYGGAAAFLWLTRKAANRWLLADAVMTGFVITFLIVR